MLLLSLIIFLAILLMAYIIDSHHADFYTDRGNPDHVLMASYVVRRQEELPPNKIINKGYNSEYWDCSELQKSMGTPNNEILSRCQKFI